MYFQNYTPPQTHLAPAETNPAFGAYELRGMGSDTSGAGALQQASVVFSYMSPIFFGYYGYKKNGSLGDAAMWGLGSIVLQVPASLVGLFVGALAGGDVGAALGVAAFPAVGAYYAFGKKD
jgi:hypothetical protein